MTRTVRPRALRENILYEDWTQVSEFHSVADLTQNQGCERLSAGYSPAQASPRPASPRGTSPAPPPAPARPRRAPRLTARLGTAPRTAAARRPPPSRPPAPPLSWGPETRPPPPAPASQHGSRPATLRAGAWCPDSWDRRRPGRHSGSAAPNDPGPLPLGGPARPRPFYCPPASEAAQDASARVTPARPAASDPRRGGVARSDGVGGEPFVAAPAQAAAPAEPRANTAACVVRTLRMLHTAGPRWGSPRVWLSLDVGARLGGEREGKRWTSEGSHPR